MLYICIYVVFFLILVRSLFHSLNRDVCRPSAYKVRVLDGHVSRIRPPNGPYELSVFLPVIPTSFQVSLSPSSPVFCLITDVVPPELP